MKNLWVPLLIIVNTHNFGHKLNRSHVVAGKNSCIRKNEKRSGQKKLP